MPQIRLSDQLKEELDSLKKRNGHKSHDSLIRALISNPCKGTRCIWYWNCMEYGCPTFKEKTEEK
ncbi:hypothetical protein ES702_03315 [subsurface metagenome]